MTATNVAAPKTQHADATRRKESRDGNALLRGPCKDLGSESNRFGHGQTVEDSRSSEEGVISSGENTRDDDSVHEGSSNPRSHHLKGDSERGCGCGFGRQTGVIIRNCNPSVSVTVFDIF